MSTLVESLEPREVWASPAAKPLDEAVWQAWIAKGRTQDRRSSAGRMTAVKSVSIVALLAAAGLWPHGMPYEVVVRFVVAAGALLAVLALLYDPVVPVFSFSGDWQRGLVVASALPFVVSFRLAQFEDRTQ